MFGELFSIFKAFLLEIISIIRQKLAENEEDTYLDSQWADNQYLRKQFQGLNNIKWKP